MIPGVDFDFGGGRSYLVPPLSLGALELLQDRIAQLSALSSMDPVAVATVIDCTHFALRRNYPALTRPEVAELVDLSNMLDVYECVLDVAGVKRKAQAAERGNAAAKGPTSAGTDSSPTSAPTPDGPGTTSALT